MSRSWTVPRSAARRWVVIAAALALPRPARPEEPVAADPPASGEATEVRSPGEVADSATPPPADARAREAFDAGRRLMEAGQHEAACREFEVSQALDPGGGTVLNLARCYDALNRTASAWTAYQEGLRHARRDGRADRIAFAEAQLAALEPRLSRLRLRVSEETKVRGLVIERNGVEVKEGTWNEAVPIDPGPQRFRASAPGMRAVEGTLAVTRPGEVEWVVPRLSGVPEASATAVTPGPLRDAASRADSGDFPWGAIGIGAMVTGAVVSGVGGYFGVRALNRDADADSLCPDQNRCDPRAFPLSKDASSDAGLATGLLIGGAALLVGGGVLTFVVAPSVSGGNGRGTAVVGAGYGGRF